MLVDDSGFQVLILEFNRVPGIQKNRTAEDADFY